MATEPVSPSQNASSSNPMQTADPNQAQAAQIPLQNFSLPTFPPQTSNLKALTLTSDIALSDYQSLLSQPYFIPPALPPSIESLTLELFSFGYPPGFLSELASRLGAIKSLVVYSQLLGGISEQSARDAVGFFAQLRNLRALHLLDVFTRPGLFTSIAPFLKAGSGPEGERKGLLFLEVNYTAQHGDEEFLKKVPSKELPLLVGPGLITLALNVAEADVTNDPDDPTNLTEESTDRITDVEVEAERERAKLQKDGVMTFNKTLAGDLIKALTTDGTRPVNMRVLNSTLYTMTLTDLASILEKQRGLMVLIVTLEVDEAESCRTQLLKMLGEYGQKIEQVEVVVSPSLKFFMALNKIPSNALEQAFPSKSDLEALQSKCGTINSFRASILRSKNLARIEWENKDGKWEGGVQASYSTVSLA